MHCTVICGKLGSKENAKMGQIRVEKNMNGIAGLCVIEPAVHGDARGYFMETYNERDMREAGIDVHFVQDNQSMSTKGVLRGLHFQKKVSAVQAGARRAGHGLRRGSGFARRFRNLWEMVRRHAVSGK